MRILTDVARHIRKTVSYTHLDVYKRQICESVICLEAPDDATLSSCEVLGKKLAEE